MKNQHDDQDCEIARDPERSMIDMRPVDDRSAASCPQIDDTLIIVSSRTRCDLTLLRD
jgi:hypothetical protein